MFPASSVRSVRSRPLATGARPGRRPRGYILLESLVCLAVIAIGAMPLALLGPLWLRLAGEHESLSRATQLASDVAEAAGVTAGMTPPPAPVALWVSP